MTLNFANQNLQNRSFKGQNLTDGNFSGSDIRGCDFSRTKLVGANFEGVKAGLSRKNVVVLLTVGLAGALALIEVLIGICVVFSLILIGTDRAITFASMLAVLTGGGILILIGVVVSAKAMGVKGEILVAAGFFVVFGVLGLVATVLLSIENFRQGHIVSSLAGIPQFCLAFAIALGGFIQLIKMIKTTIGTSFYTADLTNARFNYALLRNTDFLGATLVKVNWKGAKFSRCKFTENTIPRGLPYPDPNL
ncbi:MAG TPA: hypothetical protein DD379_06565 [Cyanobacteria bacterium UBA11162]|nr:hypothetical protein [Cyanobacteria bacterium UBA12227]HAX88676.1 hypothetical protein [Cyanobacteria bacterium UBA11370]HBL11059.1 hypothetical protein [Cyanobacteria bacterium UBA11162]HBY81855.1 hypothetical protein [Cyanobacteria bacterium UBA11148]